MDAFIALGGDIDNSESHIDGEALIRTIRDDFEMTIDIEKMIDEVDDVRRYELIVRMETKK